MSGRWGYGKREDSACHGCGNRTAGCHATCQTHAAEREAREEKRQATLEDRMAGRQYGEYKYQTKTRLIRRKEAEKRK